MKDFVAGHDVPIPWIPLRGKVFNGNSRGFDDIFWGEADVLLPGGGFPNIRESLDTRISSATGFPKTQILFLFNQNE
jgi:hypothetical protein